MVQEITNHSRILDAIRSADIISELIEKHGGHFAYELDLEVIAYGRNYNGKKVGPYVRLLVYEPGEMVVRQDEWGGNTFYILVDGHLDVYVKKDGSGAENKISELKPGTSFGEMSVLAGVPRNATIRVPPSVKAVVLEVQRPALRLLRKLPKFGQTLDATYRRHGLGRALEDVRQATGNAFTPELLGQLGEAARFVVYGKHHVIFQEGESIDRVLLLKSGWVRRARGVAFDQTAVDTLVGVDESIAVDFLGAGNCLGLEGAAAGSHWRYTATAMARTEALEVSVPHLRSNPALRDTLARTFRNSPGPTTTRGSKPGRTRAPWPPPRKRSRPASLTARTCS